MERANGVGYGRDTMAVLVVGIFYEDGTTDYELHTSRVMIIISLVSLPETSTPAMLTGVSVRCVHTISL